MVVEASKSGGGRVRRSVGPCLLGFMLGRTKAGHTRLARKTRCVTFSHKLCGVCHINYIPGKAPIIAITADADAVPKPTCHCLQATIYHNVLNFALFFLTPPRTTNIPWIGSWLQCASLGSI